jgi:hypothetical protein
MSRSVVSICNQALDLLGAASITSLDDGSKQAGLCSRNYEPARDATLRAYPWNCARARASLAAQVAAPAWGDEKVFPLPEDCLRVVAIDADVAFGLRWRVEGRSLLVASDGPVSVAYVRRMDDPTQMDELLVQAIAARLAAMLAWPVTGIQGIQDRMLALAERLTREARMIDAREQSQDDDTVADLWSGARFSRTGII